MDNQECKYCGNTPPKTYITHGSYVCKPCKRYFCTRAPDAVFVEDVKGGGSYATPETVLMGTQAERSFVELCRRANFRLRPATLYENTVMHYDYVVHWLDCPNPRLPFVRVEVKSIKSRRRGLPPDPRVLFIELKDIHGNPGWLYGKADLIAFQQVDGFLVVPRTLLVKFAESCVRDFRIAYQSGIHHTLYSRPNRNDLMMVLDIEDIYHLAIAFFPTPQKMI